VARHTGLPHRGTGLPGLPVLQSLPPQSYSSGRLHAACSPFSAHPHRLVGPLPTSADYMYCLTAVDPASHAGQQPSPSRTLQPKPWHVSS
jgi:hypothetical protein